MMVNLSPFWGNSQIGQRYALLLAIEEHNNMPNETSSSFSNIRVFSYSVMRLDQNEYDYYSKNICIPQHNMQHG